jgi:hypothetical protein
VAGASGAPIKRASGADLASDLRAKKEEREALPRRRAVEAPDREKSARIDGLAKRRPGCGRGVCVGRGRSGRVQGKRKARRAQGQ